MLNQRLITAAILLPLFIAVLFWVPANWFVLILIAIASLGAIEWSRLCGIQNKTGIFVFVLCVVVLSFLLNQFRMYALIIEILAVLMWLSLIWLLISYPQYQISKMLSVTLAVAILVFTVVAISDLILSYEEGPWLVLGMFVVIWGADIAAYFTGRRFGKNKLAPQISPGKTTEGVKGSLLAILAIALISGTTLWEDSFSRVFLWVVICMVVVLFSIIGDLYISLSKRTAGVKDSGTLLPGHGGILDRIDSTLASAPVYAVCVKVLLI